MKKKKKEYLWGKYSLIVQNKKKIINKNRKSLKENIL